MADLLFVGPQNGALNRLSRALENEGTGWVIRQTSEPKAALENLARRPAQVVLAQLGNGPELYQGLFNAISEVCPGAVRFALLDPGAAVVAGVPYAHQTLTTRDDNHYLQPILEAGVSVAKRASQHAGLARLLNRLHDVPSPPALYFDIRERIEMPDGNLAQMADIAARDPSLVARVLKIANSGFYGVPRTISDLTEAIGLIGTDALLGLVLAAHLYAGLPPPGLNLELLWQHTFRVSSLARQITRMEGGGRDAQGTSAVAGLLHDIGLMMLLENEPARYQPLWHRSGGDEAVLAKMERDTFGVTHGELGALVLALWTLPAEVVDAVANSHLPTSLDLPLTSRAVLAAEWLLDASASVNVEDCERPAPLDDLEPERLELWLTARNELAAQVAAGL